MFVRIAMSAAVLLGAVTWVAVDQQGGGPAPARADDRVVGVARAAVAVPASARPTTPAPATSTAPVTSTAHGGSAASAPVTRPPEPEINACAHNVEDKQVLVSLAAQHIWLCAGSHSRADFAVTTGRTTGGDETPTGTYEIQARTRDTTLNPDSGGAFHVKYWLPFKWGMFGFHDAAWQKIPFGSAQYRTQGSQGCVHMRTGDIAQLFDWVGLGTTVKVVSGTPG